MGRFKIFVVSFNFLDLPVLHHHHVVVIPDELILLCPQHVDFVIEGVEFLLVGLLKTADDSLLCDVHLIQEFS